LLVLGTQTDRQVPPGTRFKVNDATQQLVEQVAVANSQATYLDAQVEGTADKQLEVMVAMPNRDRVAFAFQLKDDGTT
jgi:hypothetical protein